MPTLSQLMAKVGFDDSDFHRGADNVNKKQKEIQGQAEKTGSSFKTMGEAVKKTGGELKEFGTILTVSVTAPLVALSGASLKAAIDMDSLSRGLTAVSKEGESAASQLVRLKELAKLPGLGFKEAIQGSINLQAAGLSANQAERSMKAFGNALATVGKGKTELEGVNLALGQIISKGKVSAEEINQIAERVPQIRQAMMDAFGTADTEVLQKMGISSEEFIDKTIGSLEKLPAVTAGVKNDIETMSDTVFVASAKMGQSLIPVASLFINTVVPAVEKSVEVFTSLPVPVQGTLLAIGGIAAVVGPATYAFSLMFESVSKLKLGWNALISLKPFVVAAFTGKAVAVKAATLATQEQIIAAGVAAQAAYTETAANGSFAQAANAATIAREQALAGTVGHTGAVVGNSAALGTNTGALATNTGATGANTAAKVAGRGFMGTGVGGATVATSALAAITIGYQAGTAIEHHFLGGKEREEKERREQPSYDAAKESLAKQGITPGMSEEEQRRKYHADRKRRGLSYIDESGRVVNPVLTPKQQTEQKSAEYGRKKDDFEKSAETSENAYKLQTEKAKAQIAGASSEDKAQAELKAMLPVLIGRHKKLAEENKALEPYIKASSDALTTYRKNELEQAQLQTEAAKLKGDIARDKAKADKDLAEKNAKSEKDAIQSQFETQMSIAKNGVDAANEGQKAREEYNRVVPIVLQEQNRLVQEARKLEPQIAASSEAKKEYWAIRNRIEKLEGTKVGLEKAGIAEEKRERENRAKEQKEAQKLYFDSLSERAKAIAQSAGEGQEARALAQNLVPVIQKEQETIIAEMRRLNPNSKEYWEKNKEVWKLEGEKHRIIDGANKEEQNQVKKGKDALKKAEEEAKKRNKDHLSLLEAKGNLMKARLDNDPWLTDQEKKERMVPILLQQIKALSAPIQGESELDKIKRLTEVEQAKGSIYEAAGLKGGNPIFADPRLLGSLNQMINGAIGEGQRTPRSIVGYDGRNGDIQGLAQRTANGSPVVFQVTIQPGSTREQMWNTFTQMFENVVRQTTQVPIE